MPRVTRPRLLSAVTLLIGTAALVVGPITAPANAAPLKVTITSGPTVTGDDVSLSYTINRQQKAVASRTCTLDGASTSAAVTCGNLPTGKAKASVVDLTLSDLADGTYTFSVSATMTDGGRATATSAPFTVSTNSAPSVIPLSTYFIVGDDMSVGGVVTDDGRPNPPGAVTTLWSFVSGPAQVTFDDPSAVNTGASFAEVGDYVLRLTASDGALSTSALTNISVLPDTYPEAKDACRAGPLPGDFEQEPFALVDGLWECRWAAPASDDPDSVAKANQLTFLCRSLYDGEPSDKLLDRTGAVFCMPEFVRP